jgi:hypothetical protein
VSVCAACFKITEILLTSAELEKMTNTSPFSEEIFDSVRTQGNPQHFEGHAIVGFIDLLGFSAYVQAHWNDPGNPPLAKLLRIKETAHTSRQTTIAIQSDQPPHNVTQAFRARIHIVSDSLIACSALPPPNHLSQQDFLYHLAAVVFAVLFVWDCAAEEGFTVRGAVELGQVYWTPEETIGPALVHAYSLENRCANWSRVIVGPALLRNIARLPPIWPFVNRAYLNVSEDGLIEFNPMRLSRHVPLLEAMSAAAGSSKSTKYHALLATLRGETQAREPNDAELQAAVERLRT